MSFVFIQNQSYLIFEVIGWLLVGMATGITPSNFFLRLIGSGWGWGGNQNSRALFSLTVLLVILSVAIHFLSW